MDDKMIALFSRVKKTARELGSAADSAARYAGRKAGSLMDVTKANVQIYEINNEINGLLRDAGQILYDAHLGLETSDKMMAAILSRLDEKYAQVNELRERITVMKQTKLCPLCGTPCGGEELFCKHCGTEL